MITGSWNCVYDHTGLWNNDSVTIRLLRTPVTNEKHRQPVKNAFDWNSVYDHMASGTPVNYKLQVTCANDHNSHTEEKYGVIQAYWKVLQNYTDYDAACLEQPCQSLIMLKMWILLTWRLRPLLFSRKISIRPCPAVWTADRTGEGQGWIFCCASAWFLPYDVEED